MKKTKYNRRLAINCEIIEKSKSNPGYCKYMITIQELDGTIHKQPAYGKDMQDAISRLINIERTVRIEKQLYKNPFFVFLLWVAVMVWPLAFGLASDSPHMILYSFGGIALLTILGAFWYNYIEKGK